LFTALAGQNLAAQKTVIIGQRQAICWLAVRMFQVLARGTENDGHAIALTVTGLVSARLSRQARDERFDRASDPFFSALRR
jgi:hypothetical protein